MSYHGVSSSPAEEVDSSAGHQQQKKQHSIPRKPVPSPNIFFHPVPVGEEHTSESTAKPVLTAGGDARGRLWKPLVLKRWFLFSFGLLFCACLGAIEALYQISQRQQGLVTSIQSRYYLWTYGPTALFTLVAAGWSQVEHRVKQLVPWIRMGTHPTSGSNSVLLDYVSKAQIKVVPSALKRADPIVALATAGSLLITLLIVFSTALLSLQTVLVEHAQTLTLDSSFANSADGLQNFGDLSAYVLQGIISYNLPDPYGTSDLYAYQTFNSTILPTGSVMRAKVDAFSAWLECEEADLRINQWTQQYAYNTPSSVSIPPVEKISASTGDCTASVMLPTQAGIFSITVQVSCSNHTALNEQRIFVIIGEVNAGPTSGEPSDPNVTYSYTTEVNFTMKRSTQLFCKPTYSLTKVEVTLNNTESTTASEAVIRRISGQPNSTLSNVHPWTLGWVHLGMSSATSMITTPPPNLQSIWGTSGVYYAALRRPGVGAEDLFDSRLLGSVYGDYFTMSAAQIARQGLLSTDDSPIQGTSLVNEQRLVVRELSVRVMEAVLVTLALCAFAIALLVPSKGLITRDPSSVVGLAAVLVTSSSLLQGLKGMGSASLKYICSMLSKNIYSTTVTSTPGDQIFRIHVQEHTVAKEQVRSAPNLRNTVAYWRPIVLSPWVRLGACVIILGVLAALEAVLRLSDRHTGLADVNIDGYLHYTWAYVPALVMVTISLFAASVDFATRLFAPYSALKAVSSFDRSMAVSFLTKMALPAIWSAVTLRHWSVVLSALAMTISSFLTIVVSGVFSNAIVPLNGEVQLSQYTQFNLSTEVIGDPYNNGTGIAGLILNANMSYPTWTWDELAFAQLRLRNQDVQDDQSSSPPTNFTSLHFTTPAIRSVLNCTSYSGVQAMNATMIRDLYASNPGLTFSASLPGSSWCQSFGLTQSLFFGDHTGLFGFYQDIGIDACPSFVYFWGRTAGQTINHVAAMVCSERVAQVEVDADFLYPSFAINPARQPVQNDSTLKYHYPPGGTTVIYANTFLPNVTASTGHLDTFFATLVVGKDGIPISDLGDPTQNEKVQDSIRHLHYLIRAQQYAASLRINATDETKSTSIPATATNPNRVRLMQNAISTRVLEAMLGAVVLCLLLAGVLMDTKDVLPKNPCSIAAGASLLADSTILGPDFLGAESQWLSDKELEHVLWRQRFRMGWFGDGDRGVDCFKIDFADGLGDSEEKGSSASEVGHVVLDDEEHASERGQDGDQRVPLSSTGVVRSATY